MAATVMEIYGSKVFNEHEMRERLPSSTYKSLKATIEKGQPLTQRSTVPTLWPAS